ncbi:ERBB receptor feedback inhibitor 1 [Acanthopagrus latus]|uniref:ERBB receptor feedback inhibitor 1 n=1 Tax=Acanthopagrus latus TaxID=8177 RepID=UPI00187C6EA3|nr:ERBB receptor feedback inhibitor 1 [Acanthopagrus latus]XP_036959966.1 ERBB receptor feedback inhibitor 1 [Acanthopagrus latus]XP_036959967.1 ERBB receptor feedback inhibitor 1 [Acanthopagrus latus]XP_036959968.1 ERBB receptor feedback inhibitor 1 [Acanthopagrus latus]XP_036959969.1 ERBB receptor feedback inhibitor 1 [Acanthopagrus latus]XP_036959970.1 ERBB receptor feedback inhibitor 1 [Acanthopagrus latus]XP_036959972.1 ERBB receptor feedback inhibitor 1 [Acanthopagrus latus]XP_03695997
MAASQNNYWGQHDLNRMCFRLSADMDHNLTELQQQQIAKEFNCNISDSQPPFYSDTCRLTSDSIPLPHEGDQVVPSSHRRSIFGDHQRESKPLPPLPDPEELMSDEAADSEVEFFTSDRRRLLPKSCPKSICRGTNRDSGQVNYAYQETHLRSGGPDTIAFSWPNREDRPSGRGSGFGANIWALPLQREDHQHVASDTLCSKDQHPASRRFSCSGHSSITACPTDKPQVPPRIPIPPKPAALSKNEEDKPPKIPPRVPLVPPCPPRTPSPKSLPIYINGVMPATQSFAANPKYVSKALQRQQSERAPPAAQCSPCIVPILKDGRQASTTHYILLPPGRPAYSERRERLLSEPARIGNSSIWQNR